MLTKNSQQIQHHFDIVWFQKISIPPPMREFHLGPPFSPDFPFFEVSYNPPSIPPDFPQLVKHTLQPLWKISLKKGEC